MIESLRIGPEKNFTYLIACSKTGAAALVDPAFEQDRILDWVEKQSTEVGRPKTQFLIATHGHWDHSGGFEELKTRIHAKVLCSENEVPRLLKSGIHVDFPVTDNQVIELGEIQITALHTPGHTEGGCCYLVKDPDYDYPHLLSGDTLFIGQCGRTDLAGGSDDLLFESLQRLKKLDPKTMILPGHDYGRVPKTRLDEELRKNPTLMAKTLAEFKFLP